MKFGLSAKTTAIICLPLFFSIPSIASAQIADSPSNTEQPAADSSEIVVVGDNGKSYKLTADSLRDAAKAFLEHRANYAPDARLYFHITPATGETLEGIEFSLNPVKKRAGSDPINLELDNRRIELPAELLAKADWELKSNSPRSRIEVKPLVLSSDSTIIDRRLGDMRLQCRVAIAFARIPGPLRLLAAAVSPCESSMVQMYDKAEEPLLSVNVDGYTGPSLIMETDPQFFRVPLSDKNISNDARIKLIYGTPMDSPSKEAAAPE